MSNLVLAHPDEAKRELARRELARRRLLPFVEYVSPWYKGARPHSLIAEYLELVETYARTRGRTGIGRLLLEFPPRSGKSELTSRHFPAWFLGRNPDMRVILASYGADLAVGHSRAARAILDGESFKAVFGELGSVDAPVELSSDSRSAEEWDLAAPHRGGFKATGVGGAITGKGANVLIVDDPFKNRDEAESESQRQRVWDWWTSSAYTRLEDGAAVIGMFTRWHGDDWGGRLLAAMANDPKADQYVVVACPAIWEPPVYEGDWEAFYLNQLREGVYEQRVDPLGRKPGEALWPEKYNEQDLERIKANVGLYDWEALYQQRPYRRGGNFFRREWFTIIEEPPKAEAIVQRIRVWDKAGNRSGRGGDYATGVLLSVTQGRRVYVEHVSREQTTPSQREETILRVARTDRGRGSPTAVIWHQQDPGTAGLESAQNTNNRLAREGFEAHFAVVTGEKEVRAGPWASALEGGSVMLVRGGWNEAFIEEHTAFPKGRFDDQVDAASWGFMRLAGMTLDGQLFF